MSSREKLPADLRRIELQDAAIEVVRTQGWARLTCRAVADVAGCSLPLVKHYYGNVQELTAVALKRAGERRMNALLREARKAGLLQ